MVMISVKQKNNFSQSISRDHVVITDFWTLTDNNEIQLPSNMEIICNNEVRWVFKEGEPEERQK